ncbi:hypothetical protein SETIT_6G219300v2 [Setaria italica]|uniref:Uncharacterized protein n=1 Tax=Setaria italica TaxID=4555 RepID=A0A368RP36_SETIT|nr:hypothetical protein SETIT_6G219300v2 [Setaria italica]
MIRVKLMEAELRVAEMMTLKDAYQQSMRRTLLETPSGFAIFYVSEDVFKQPRRIWARFTDEMDAHEKVKCCTKFSNDDDVLGNLMWGLKNVLHEFIPQEKDDLTKENYLPMSKGLQSALVSYGISVSLGQVLILPCYRTTIVYSLYSIYQYSCICAAFAIQPSNRVTRINI